MVFWKTYPLSTWIRTLFPSSPFHDVRFEKEQMESPTGYPAERVDSSYRTDIRMFLKTYFGNPPSTPILDIPEMELLPTKDSLFFVKDSTHAIAGCIRYHFLGSFQDQPMYVVDCFCIHPSWRKKGVGDYLLTVLHDFVNKNNIPYCLFLKEGQSLSILSFPIYSSRYAVRCLERIPFSTHPHVYSLSIHQAHRAIDLFQECNPSLFIVRNRENISNQIWKLYRKGIYTIIACIQDTYQWFIQDNEKKRMGWITCWIESPGIPSSIQEEASIAIADSVGESFDYLWTNEEWTGDSNQWMIDGYFHWYSYQWSTSIRIQNQYCIVH